MKYLFILLIALGASAESTNKSPCQSDDRTVTDDLRIGRNLRVGKDEKGCTAFLIGKSCMITAAHCVEKTYTVQFNVPMSDANGEIQHPAAFDQYQVDTSSINQGSKAYSNDFAVFKTFKNSITGRFAGEVQGKFDLNYTDFKKGDLVSIRGYGYNHARVPEEFNVQKSDTGPIKRINGKVIYYNAYTSNGNSGSPIIHEKTGAVIGVHTNGGGCYSGGRGNHGYLLKDNIDFQQAVEDCLKSN
jgi:V8-like Glu-specific endopeptidase